MQFFIFVLLICFFIFLYCVYVLSSDDFIFLRKDVTMEKLFNIIFLGSLISLFFARVFYGLSHGGNIFSNPLVFLLFPYFPGLSLLGGVVGAGTVFLFLKTRKNNPLPLGRISDFFSIAFLISFPIGFLGYFLFSNESFSTIKSVSQGIVYMILFLVFLKFFHPRLLSGKFKEGTISYLFLIFFSLVSLFSNALPKINVLSYITNFENIIFVSLFILSTAMLIRQEKLFKIKDTKKKK